jgi:molybdopterin molybdotransferase
LKIQASVTHINDDKEILKNKIESYLKNFDVLMFSGAVSKGKFDFLPEVLDELGVQKKFHKVKQRPGKPFWFGKKAEKTVFAFPGNPVSTFISCLKYFHPWFWKSMGVRTVEKNAVLKSDFHFKPALTYFLQVKAEQKDGIIWAYPVTGKGSGDLANLIDADGFLELPEDRSSFVKGETFPLITYRN